MVSSLLMVLMNGAWYLCAAALILAVALTLVGGAFGVHIDANGPSLEVGPNVTMSIPVSLHVEGDTHRVTAPALGTCCTRANCTHSTCPTTATRSRFACIAAVSHSRNGVCSPRRRAVLLYAALS